MQIPDHGGQRLASIEGVTVSAMIEFEADDALVASGSTTWWPADTVSMAKMLIVTPDKDLGQCVVGDRVVQSSTAVKGFLSTRPE